MNNKHDKPNENEWPTLGEKTERIVLASPEKQLECACSMLAQGKRFLRIFDRDLSHHIYDNRAFAEALSVLARRSRFSDIRILINDSHLLVKTAHAILGLNKRLSSSISIKIVTQHSGDLPYSFLLVDDSGLITHTEDEHEPGFANFNDRVQVAKFTQDFDDLWHRSSHDPELRNLSL